MRLLLLLPVLSALLLPACSRDDQPPPPKLFEGQRNALEKSKGVEDQVLQQADQQRQEIDRQTE